MPADAHKALNPGPWDPPSLGAALAAQLGDISLAKHHHWPQSCPAGTAREMGPCCAEHQQHEQQQPHTAAPSAGRTDAVCCRGAAHAVARE